MSEHSSRTQQPADAQVVASGGTARGLDAAHAAEGLSRQTIIETAIRIADAEGLGAVSVRRLAKELRCEPAGVYRHVEDMEDLLASMTDEVAKSMLVKRPLPENWRQAVTEIARRLYITFASHRWLMGAFGKGCQLGPNIVRHTKQMARSMVDLGLDPAEMWTALGIVNDYVIGHAGRSAPEATARGLEEALWAGDLVEIPELTVLLSTTRRWDSGERFEVGLQTVLDGIEWRFLAGR